jgi:hypothetical protein
MTEVREVREVRIHNASLEEDSTGRIIIRGVLDQSTLKWINMAWYQRKQAFSNSHIEKIVGAYYTGGVHEDIVIGMRGDRCDSKNNVYMLRDKCFCINGGQRLYAAAVAMKQRPDLKISLGVKAYTGTTEELENEMFVTLGTGAKRIAASIIIRNRRKDSAAVALLVDINKDPDFALKNRIAWDQVKSRYELMTGLTFTKILGRLHGHLGALKSSTALDLVVGFDALLTKIGEENLRTNILRFFDGIDKCWSLRQIADSYETHPQLSAGFLMTVAELFSAYSEFWDGKTRNEFYFGEKYVKLLRGFKLADYIHSQRKFPRDALFEVLRKQLKLKPIFQSEAEDEPDPTKPKGRGKGDETRPTA